MRDDLEETSLEKPVIDWYIARDGQQFVLLSEPEMQKFNELGHLRANDLVWRKGFPDWRPAGEVFDDIARGGATRP